MMDKSVWAILAGMLGVGAIGGGTVAIMQQQVRPNQVEQRNASAPVAIAPQSPAVLPATTPTISNRASATPHDIPTPAPRSVSSCRVVMAIVKDDTPLNVRSQPNTATGKVLTTLKEGTFVNVKQEVNGWFEITNPAGWIAKSKTVSRCGEKLEQVTLAPEATEIADEFLGTGSHRYQLQLSQGQTLSIQGAVGPMPGLIAPNGQHLIGMDEIPGEWSKEISSTGTYTLEMASNFRGYKYAFTIALK